MLNQINNISAAIDNSLNGDSLPSFKSAEFETLLLSITQLGKSEYEELRSIAFEEIGRRVVENILNRMSASMNAEREIAIIKDKGLPLC